MFIITVVRSLSRTLDRVLLRDVVLVCLADGVVAMSFGALSVAGGLPGWVPVTMSLLVFAGGAQFSAVGVVLAGGGPVAAVLTGLLLNTRHLPFGFAVADVFGSRVWQRLLGSHVIVDESVAFAVAQRDPTRRRIAFWTCGVALFIVWNLGAVFGVLAGHAIRDTNDFGLDAMLPAVLLALVMPALRDAGTARAALVGAAIALGTTPLLPPGVPVLLALAGLVVAGQDNAKERG